MNNKRKMKKKINGVETRGGHLEKLALHSSSFVESE
jgi:hypothetical protein